MNSEEIIEMAKQAGFTLPEGETWYEAFPQCIEDFAKLVAAKATDEANARANASWTLMCKKMVAAERDACLQIQEDWQYTYANDLVQKIRARGQHD
jgi:hypothetical protein